MQNHDRVAKSFANELPVRSADFFARMASEIFALPERGWATLEVWRNRSEYRHALATMDSRQLDDIGLERAVADQEASKPFWRA